MNPKFNITQSQDPHNTLPWHTLEFCFISQRSLSLSHEMYVGGATIHIIRHFESNVESHNTITNSFPWEKNLSRFLNKIKTCMGRETIRHFESNHYDASQGEFFWKISRISEKFSENFQEIPEIFWKFRKSISER